MTGQRIIGVLAQILVFIVALIPAALAFGAVFFLSQLLLSRLLAIVPACLAATLVLAAEALLGIGLLGQVFEKFDVSSELPPG